MSRRQQYQGSGSPLPIALIGQAIRKLSRHELEAVTERLIEMLDTMDGDPDLEDDDPGGTDLDKGEDDGANGWARLLPEPSYAYSGHDQTVILERNQYGFDKRIELDKTPSH